MPGDDWAFDPVHGDAFKETSNETFAAIDGASRMREEKRDKSEKKDGGVPKHVGGLSFLGGGD